MDEHAFNQFARDIFESLYYFVAIDEREQIVFINREYAAALGTTQDAAIGQPIKEVILNTRMPQVLASGKPELGRYMVAQGVKPNCSESTICNRIPIFRNGDREHGEIIGAVGEGIIRDFQNPEQIHAELELLRNQNELLQAHLSEVYQSQAQLDKIIGTSPAIEKLKSLIQQVSKSSITVCIYGETGTGKELVANAIHETSKRAGKPFVKINCAAIPKDLLESELFGYEGGAFTGADRRGKAGRFELANHGTLLLDEIGELPITLQAKLLRVLQEKEVERVGGQRPIPLDVRLLCSTNRDLEQMVKDGEFRADLYYRLNTLELRTPPLRERLDDIPVLCDLFIRKTNHRDGLAITGISADAIQLLQSHRWPGNVRELEHVLERAAVLLGYGELNPSHFDFLNERIQVQNVQNTVRQKNAGFTSYHDRKSAMEQEAILDALRTCHGNKSAAARLLNMDRTVLYSKLKKYGIQ